MISLPEERQGRIQLPMPRRNSMAGKGGKGGGGGGQGGRLNVQLSRAVAQRLSDALTRALGSSGDPVSVPLSRDDWQDILIAVANVSPFPSPKGKGKGKGII